MLTASWELNPLKLLNRLFKREQKKFRTGACALSTIVENLLMDLMNEVHSDPTSKQAVIERECVTGEKPPMTKHSKEETG